MTGYLLDTNILSELKRRNPNQNVLHFLNSRSTETLFISLITVAEIRYGIETAPAPALASEIEQWLENIIRPMFKNRILEPTEDIMLEWRLLLESGRVVGHTYPQPDLIIAATAAYHDLTIVTRNVKDFSGLNLEIINPWEV